MELLLQEVFDFDPSRFHVRRQRALHGWSTTRRLTLLRSGL